MKKFVCIILSLVMMSSLFAVDIYAEETHSVNISASAQVEGQGIVYNSDGSAFVESTSIIGWSIPTVYLGDSVTVTVKGSSDGDFRVWLLGDGQATMSNQWKASENGFNGGNFEYTFDLEFFDKDGKGLNSASAIAFKAPTWNTSLSNITVKSVTITYHRYVPEPDLPPEYDTDKTQWIAAWGSAQLKATDDHLPKNIALSGNTVRQQIRPSISGTTIRFVFSNEQGNGPLTINKATVAKLYSPSSPQINPLTLKTITFGGSESVIIQAGRTVTSDPIRLSYSAFDDLAISTYLGSVPTSITSHTASRCDTWVDVGDMTSSQNMSTSNKTTSWYFLSRMETTAIADAGAIVALGDSLTDGASCSTNGFARWTDELARQLHANGYENYSVINMGIGATPMRNIWGQNGVKRFENDVLNIKGAKYAIIYYGTNDIGKVTYDISGELISIYKDWIKKCHDKGIKIYGVTVTPFYGNSYYNETAEKVRVKFNEWIMSSDSGLDGYIDVSSAVQDPALDPPRILKKYVSNWNDNLHFNDAGYKFVGQTIYEAIKQEFEPKTEIETASIDLNNDGETNNADAIYLLYHVIFGNEYYPISVSCDFTGDGVENNADAIYLLYHIIFGMEQYPIYL